MTRVKHPYTASQIRAGLLSALKLTPDYAKQKAEQALLHIRQPLSIDASKIYSAHECQRQGDLVIAQLMAQPVLDKYLAEINELLAHRDSAAMSM